MKGLTREWRCWREDGSYYGPCPPIEEPWEHEVWREDRHGDCGWQLYVMEADLNGVPMRLIPDNAELEAILHDHFTEDAQAVLDALDGETRHER